MKKVRLGLCRGLGLALVVGSFGVAGCSNDGPTPAPESKGSRDKVQKDRETKQVGDAPAAKKPGRR
jgi:hypothetical protein